MAFTCAYSNGFSNGYEICTSGPLQVLGGTLGSQGARRADFDHLADVRANDSQLMAFQRILHTGEKLRHVTRQYRSCGNCRDCRVKRMHEVEAEQAVRHS